MTKLKLLALGVLIATSSSVAQAESDLSLGAGVGVVENAYKQYDNDVYPVPVVTYDSENFWFRGLGAVTTCGMTIPISCLSWLTGHRCTLSRATAITVNCVDWINVRAP